MNLAAVVRRNIEAVVIGASAGGIQALSEILPALAPDATSQAATRKRIWNGFGMAHLGDARGGLT